MLLGTLGTSVLGNLLFGKGILRAGSGCPFCSSSKNNRGKGILSAGSGNNKRKGFLRAGSGHPLSFSSKKKWDF